MKLIIKNEKVSEYVLTGKKRIKIYWEIKKKIHWRKRK